MTEAEIRARVVETARKHLGKNEADGSHREIIDAYNAITPLPVGYRLSYDDPWCAAFISVVGQESGCGEILYPECSCGRMRAAYSAAGLWMEDDTYAPRPGDLIMYGWSDSGSGDYMGPPDHVGIVEECDGKVIRVIEGNYADSVRRRSLTVDGRYIRGFCLPDYRKAAKPEADAAGGIFPDVPEKAWYAEDVRWAVERGIVQGYADGLFHPDEPCTRAQVVALMRRLADGDKE